MKAIFDLDFIERADLGKGASRRLRRLNDLVPAIVYGGKSQPMSISLDHKKLLHALENEAFYSHILTLNGGKKKQQVVLKAIQRHPSKKRIIHVDFLRVSASDEIVMKVPLHFMDENICPGAKKGGVINHLFTEIEIKCKASNLPEFIEVSLAKIDLNQNVHLSDLILPKGVEVVALSQGQDTAIINVHLPSLEKEDEEVVPAAEIPATKIKGDKS